MLHESRLLQADWLNGHLNNGMPSRVVSTNPIVNLIRTHQIQGRTPMVSMRAFAMPFDALDIESVYHLIQLCVLDSNRTSPGAYRRWKSKTKSSRFSHSMPEV
jgi:hypothetical protein